MCIEEEGCDALKGIESLWVVAREAREARRGRR